MNLQVRHRFNRWFHQLNTYRVKRIFILCLATLGISAGAIGTVLYLHWQKTDRAVRTDAGMTLDQIGQQLESFLQIRRESFAMVRDTLDEVPDLEDPQRQAIAKSALDHNPDLIGIGLIHKGESFRWWIPPVDVTPEEMIQLSQQVKQKTWLRTLFRLPSTLTLFSSKDRSFFVTIEPLRAKLNRTDLIIAVFDPKILLGDFFKRTLQRSLSVRLLEGDHELYRLGNWRLPSKIESLSIVNRQIRSEGIQWILQIQARVQPAVPLSWLNLLIGIVFTLAGLAILGMIWMTERLRQLATTDELTGLYNRRFFLERWEQECERANRYGRDLSCLVIDVNGFKRVNDVLGHPMGDRVLKEVAQELKNHLRKSEILARYGGDEFIVALPETNLRQASSVVDKLGKLSIHVSEYHPQLNHLSLSVGLSQMQRGEDPHHVIQRADVNLYVLRHGQETEQSFVQSA